MKYLLFPLLFFFVSQNILLAQEGGGATTGNPGDDPESVQCGGVERWAVKVLTDAAAAQVNYIPRHTTMDSLIHISTTPSTTAPRMAGIEFQAYDLTCRITIKKNEDDNDYHLVMADGGETMVGEVPDPVCAVAATSAHVNEFIAARNWVNLHIGTGAVPNVNIPAVEITGVAFVDVPHGQTGSAPNQMEFHPILSIQFAVSAGLNDTPAYRVTVNPAVFSGSARFHIISGREMFGNCRLEIYSMAGTRVNDLDIPAESRREIDYTYNRNGLPAGTYIYRILNMGSILYEGKIIMVDDGK
ncbi:MAG: hypothetical protein WCK34_02915 [Bacteroidota bacterium]